MWSGEPVATWANLITTIRTVAAIVLGFAALLEQSMPLLAIAYATYWIGDSADGNVARLLKQETRLGAVYDILSDRANSALLIAVLLVLRPEFAPALGVYFVQFMVIDTMLTLSFLRWPIVSPNYFYKVDRRIWQLNWSVPAKTANTTLLIILLFLTPIWLATAVAGAQLALKAWSVLQVLKLGSQELTAE